MNKLKAAINTAQKYVKKTITTWLKYGVILSVLLISQQVLAETTLADKPLFSTKGQTANVALALSVEFPTALGSAYTDSYANTKEYVGYWDANKCYAYQPALKSNAFQGPRNTGVNSSNSVLANNATDLYWTVTNKPGGGGVASNSNLITVNTGSGSDTNSSYIGASTAAGNYTYATTFSIPASYDPKMVAISFTLWADDSLVQVLVDNVNTGITNGSISWNNSGTITIPAGTFSATGNHTLSLVVNNTGGFGGIRVDDMSSYTVDPDGSYFVPKSTAAANHVCNTGATPYWSGNFLNWALTQTIDPFRYALSGGYRAVDKVGLTVLEKAYASGQGGTVADPAVLGNAALIAKSTPFTNLTNITMRINGLGNKFYFTGSGNNYATGGILISDGGVPATPDITKVYEMYARVKVCDPALLGAETNCTKYSATNYKPEGLIQKNAKKLNFAAFGYLLDNDIKRDGGVLRARMAALGPIKKLSDTSEVTNPNPEWDANTGIFYTNPVPADATASGVTQSGVVNYLNKFGLTAGLYKTYDPVGELYYTATRYFKNQGNVAAYTANLDNTKKDGFPVITNWDDPIKNECQANFIIGIGDSNTHADVNLPGTTIQSGNEPTLPPEVQADTSVNARVATNKVGELENVSGYTKLGEKYTPWCCNNNGFMMAGIAYDSHTKDIRPNDFKPSTGVKTTKQTIETYWLDVLESGDRKDFLATGMRNQFWLTAKYGGFTVPTGYDPYAATLAPVINTWDTTADNNDDPDNYFRANNPALMISGLTKAFDDISFKSGKGNKDQLALSSNEIQENDISVATSYDANNWTGDVIGSKLTFVSTKALPQKVKPPVWAASGQLDARDSSTRAIATSKCDYSSFDTNGTKICAGTGVAFRAAADLLAANATDLTATGNIAQDVVDFIRGNRNKEDNVKLRIREHILGDIANSKVVVVGAPNNSSLNETYNAGYTNFKNAYAARTQVAYVGANDGMLHAFNAAADSTGGNELFAYIPSFLFKGPNGTPAIDGLAALTKAPYVHHQYVDATPMVRDVNFGGGSSDWHTLLVGGLGKGGKGYYALDVTNPASLTNEANLAAAVKWEFTDIDMGYSYGKPSIVKIKNSSFDGWVVIVTSGYNNSNKYGYFYVLNAKNGALIKKIRVNTSTPSTDTGLGPSTVWINNLNSFYADAAYAGDLLGNVWRLNIKDFTVTNVAQLQIGNQPPQPITTKVLISVDKASGNRYLLVGTGKLLDDSDSNNTQVQSIYAIMDGFGGENDYFGSGTALPGSVQFPIKRANLNENKESGGLAVGILNPAPSSLGWYFDLNANFFISIDMAVNTGILAAGLNKIDGNSCSSAAYNDIKVFNFGSGKAATDQPTEVKKGYLNNIFFYVKSSGGVKGVLSVGGSIDSKEVSGGGTTTPGGSVDDGTVEGPPLTTSGGLNFRQLNWRDLPTAD